MKDVFSLFLGWMDSFFSLGFGLLNSLGAIPYIVAMFVFACIIRFFVLPLIGGESFNNIEFSLPSTRFYQHAPEAQQRLNSGNSDYALGNSTYSYGGSPPTYVSRTGLMR